MLWTKTMVVERTRKTIMGEKRKGMVGWDPGHPISKIEDMEGIPRPAENEHDVIIY